MTTAPPPASQSKAAQRRRVGRIIVTVALTSLGIHLAAGLIAGFVIVARYLTQPPPELKVVKDIRIPAQEREHAMNMAEFDGLAAKPSFADKLQSSRPSGFALPDLPKVPMSQMLPLDPAAIVSDQVTSMVGTAGLGGGGQAGGGLGGTGTGVAFLGIQTTARRVLLLYDISRTVANAAAKAGYPMERIRDETVKLIDNLGINTRFGLAQFAQNYAFFRSELVPATDTNRAAGRQWLEKHFATTGTMPRGVPNVVTGSPGFLELLKAAFRMKPDVIFIISDGSFQRGQEEIPWPEIDRAFDELERLQPAQIHFVGAAVRPEDLREVRRVLSKHGHGGQFRELR